MTTAVVKYKKEQGIKLPQAFLQSLNIIENDEVEVWLENNRIMLRKLFGKKHKTTKERLQDFYGTISPDAEKLSEIDWGQSVGQEIW